MLGLRPGDALDIAFLSINAYADQNVEDSADPDSRTTLQRMANEEQANQAQPGELMDSLYGVSDV